MLDLKVKIKQFLGMDSPLREIALHFNLPKVSGRVEAGQSDGGDLQRELDEAKNLPCEYFGLLLAEVKHINRCALSAKQRLAVTHDICKLYYPMALAQVARHAKTGGVPEEDERRQALNLLVEIAQILMVSFQILFAGYYGSSNFRYARARNTVLHCAASIFELLILKQQARALRYQLLDESDWQLANTLFYVMKCYEDIAQPLPSLQKVLELGGSRSKVSLQEQFATLHIFAKFDMLRWPGHLQWVIASYLHSVENAVQIRLDEKAPVRNELVAYCYGSFPAQSRVSPKPPGAALIFSCNGLVEAIRNDCMGLMQARKNHDAAALPPRFARFPEAEHFVISEQLVRGLQSDEGVVLEKEIRAEDLRIFVGFAEVFALLRHRQSQYASEDRLADVLAKRSALIAEDHVATEKSVWSLLFQNEKMIRLSTQETCFTAPMKIGSLLAYGIGEDINRPSLAVVSRIFRSSRKVVVIDMYCIAHYVEAVVMSFNAAGQMPIDQNRGKPALLAYSKTSLGGWGLLFPPQDILPGIDQFALHRNQQEFAIKLGTCRNATNDFYLHSISLQSEQLGFIGEPDYTTPTVSKTRVAGLWI